MLPEDFSNGEKKDPRLMDQSVDSRPREKAMSKGIGSLTVSELWALILRAGGPGYPITTLCEELMKANDNSLLELERQDIVQLVTIKGIGRSKALQVLAVMELIRRYNTETPKAPPIIKNADDIYKVMRPVIGNLPHEEIWLMLLNQQHGVKRKLCITQGSGNASLFDLKKVLRTALYEDCNILVLCHNHPSGNLNPSPQDDVITHKLVEGCKAMDFRLLDHVIVTSSGFYSYASSGRLK